MPSRLLITNVRVVLPHRLLEPGYVYVEDGCIAEVGEGTTTGGSGLTEFDGAGAYLLPGLVDIHSDAVEKEIQPRPNVTFPIGPACGELERKLAANGITTIFHSISFSAGEGVRSNDLAATIARHISGQARQCHLIRNLVHLRYEISNTAALELMEELIAEGVASLFSFMDHTPGQGQYGSIEQYKKYVRKTYWLKEEECDALVAQKIRERQEVDPARLRFLAATAQARGVPLASHDDDTPDKVEEMYRLGASIAEFPVNLATARHARLLGMHVCVGAPNILRGGSHENNLKAREALDSGAADILCSDYYPPALLQAVFYLAADGYSLPAAVRLATLNPAQATGLVAELGSVEEGKKADLILVRLIGGQPVIMGTVTGGKLVARFAYHLNP
ncbi:phosphonate metabolism protein PhnM [Desulfofundulus sp. TPOSR]|uniref:phosphonate metabolism protein PhnM n=1 Tax=Desulfofundulus sp. TPOSR TaxID=2714340 RepID=UPI0014075AA5|nr:phosphonate metabolism protein PhnM [Desulfofundulus sp. TPOSR]NHM27588.1 phosphonate metabolism protein PhnM [Desulfofundulus sp. TPOSR]